MDYLDKSRPVVVGVSGGADSLCLLGILKSAGYSLIAAHLNHKLRSEAETEEKQVCQIANHMGIAYVSEAVDVKAFGESYGYSVEEAARKCRYQFLFETAREKRAQAVAVAHTADDQVETTLMHLVRGAGLAGLKGMLQRTILVEFDSDIPLVRPILHLWRSDTESYCQQNRLDYIVDSSNKDQTFFRNRLRHSLIPELETYNPQIKKALLRMTLSLQDDHELLNRMVDHAWEASVADQGEGYVIFRGDRLENFPAGMRRNLVRRAMFILRPGLRDVDFELLNNVANSFLVKKSPDQTNPVKQMDLAGGVWIFREVDRIIIARYEADLPSSDWPQAFGEIHVSADSLGLGNNWQLVFRRVEGDSILDMAKANDDPYIAWIDAGKASGKFSIRPPKEGDAFHPLGMNGQTVKLSDYFVNIKLPKRARLHWPLLLVDNEIAWLMGLRTSHHFQLDQNSRVALRLELKRLP